MRRRRHYTQVLGAELRALANLGAERVASGELDPYDHFVTGLSGFGPNINLVKDPRYGAPPRPGTSSAGAEN